MPDQTIPHRVEVSDLQREFDGFFKIDSARVSFQRFDGTMSAPATRLVVERGDAAAVLPYDRARREVVLVQQFRFPAYVRQGPGWLWEMIAGMIEPGDAPAETARREAMEETGYRLQSLRHIVTVFPSPGGSSERLHLYVCPVTAEDRVAPGGGLPQGGEDIRVQTFGLDEALQMVEDGGMVDAKTALALYYTARHWDEL